MITNTQPSEDKIEATITKIYDKLETPGITAAVKEGYEEAVDILADDKRKYTDISPLLKTTQGRAIAVLAVDYLNGECTQKVLCGVPIKKDILKSFKK